MYKYVFDLDTNDHPVIDDRRVTIDCFIPISDDIIGIDGYYLDNGDDFFQVFDLNDEIRVDNTVYIH